MKQKQSHKYNRIERLIARQIHDIKTKQRHHFNKWHEWDIKLNQLKLSLNGKYNEKFIKPIC